MIDLDIQTICILSAIFSALLFGSVILTDSELIKFTLTFYGLLFFFLAFFGIIRIAQENRVWRWKK